MSHLKCLWRVIKHLFQLMTSDIVVLMQLQSKALSYVQTRFWVFKICYELTNWTNKILNWHPKKSSETERRGFQNALFCPWRFVTSFLTIMHLYILSTWTCLRWYNSNTFYKIHNIQPTALNWQSRELSMHLAHSPTNFIFSKMLNYCWTRWLVLNVSNGTSNIPKIFEFELFTYAISKITSDRHSKFSFVPL